MSDNSGTQSNDSGSTPPTTQSDTGQNTPSQQTPPSTTTQNNDSGNVSQLLNSFTQTLNALPETIAKSVKEAVGTPVSQQSSPSGTANNTNSSTATNTSAGDGGSNGAGSTDTGAASGNPGRAQKDAAPSTGGKPNKFAAWWFGTK